MLSLSDKKIGTECSSSAEAWRSVVCVASLLHKKRGEPGKLRTCVLSGVTNFNITCIWYNSKLAKIKAWVAGTLNSSISTLKSAVNQQVEMIQPLHYESKTTICMVTWLPGIELTLTWTQSSYVNCISCIHTGTSWHCSMV